jgi:succinoglycan biosynthesis transport protein ExoP
MSKHWDEPMAQAEPSAITEHDSGTPYAAAARTGAGELQFRELVRMLRRRSRFILITTLCGALIVFALGISISPKYTAKAQLVIDQGTTEAAALSKDDTVVESHATMLHSRDHLRHVMESLRDDPGVDPALRADKQGDIDRDAAQTSPRYVAPGLLSASSELAARLKIWSGRFIGGGDRTRLILDQLERRLSITHEARSRIIGVSFTWTDPNTAAIVANRVVTRYIEIGRERNIADDKAEIARLDSRIAEVKAEMEQSTAAVQAMLQKPDVTKPVEEIGEVNQRMQRLERDAAAKAQLYRSLLQRQQQLLDRQETVVPDAHVLSLAPPPDRPSSPNPLLFIPPAFILFLMGGSLLAVLLERLDRGLRSEREIDEALGIPCIGLVPRVEEVDRKCPLHQYLLAEPFTAYAEAVRSIAATMQLASPSRHPKVLMVTSSLPGEGKSTLAVSLSASIALMRRRVLLIDLDSRRASTLRELEGDSQRGVTDLLLTGASRELSASKLVKPVPELGIDYLPMNRFSIYSFMRFADEEMPSLIRKLRDSYDYVILNSPPVLGRTETRLLATLADEIFFAVKWGSTRREFAQNALSLLRNDDATSLAPRLQSVNAVITQVDLKKHAHYGYGDIGEYFSSQEKDSLRLPTAAITATTFRTSRAGFLRKLIEMLATGHRKTVSPSLPLRKRVTHWAASSSKARPGGSTS